MNSPIEQNIKNDTFWTITYGKREDLDYSDDQPDQKYAYIVWDAKNDEYNDMMTQEFDVYLSQRYSKEITPTPFQLGWYDELLAGIGQGCRLDFIRHKWDGEFLVFYKTVVTNDTNC
jgi:hypothetical protein